MRLASEVRTADDVYKELANWDMAVETLVAKRDAFKGAIVAFSMTA